MAFSFCLAYLSVLNKLKNSNVINTELFVKNKALQEITYNLKDSFDTSDESVHKENFIKFLSDSRDWAFDYIESSQKTIQEVADNLNKMGLKEDANKLYVLLPENKGN